MGCYIWYSEEGTGRDLPRCTKCNSPPISVPTTVLLYNGSLLCVCNVLVLNEQQHRCTRVDSVQVSAGDWWVTGSLCSAYTTHWWQCVVGCWQTSLESSSARWSVAIAMPSGRAVLASSYEGLLTRIWSLSFCTANQRTGTYIVQQIFTSSSSSSSSSIFV